MPRFIIPQDTTKKGDADFLFKKQSEGIPVAEPEENETKEDKKAKDNPFLKNVERPTEVDNKIKKDKKKTDKKADQKNSKEKAKAKEKKAEKKPAEETIIVKKPEQQLPEPKVLEVKPDSVIAVPPKPKQESFLSGHEQSIKNNFSIIQRKTEHEDGIFLILVLVFGLFGWINYYQGKRLTQIMASFFITRYIKQLIREENALLQRVFVIFSIVFILVFSTFLYQAANFYQWTIFNAEGFVLFVISILTIAIVYFVKILFVTFVGGVLDAESQVKEYFYNVVLINSFLGLLLLPLVVLIAYNPIFPKGILIKAGIFLFLGTLIYRTSRSFVIGLGYNRFSIFHLFLYLCTLEILPLVVLIKLFIGKI